jgi:hypothetical protein
MRLSQRGLLPLTLLTFGLPVLAQCPMGSAKLRGRVDSLPADVASAEVSVTLETPKGAKTKAAPVSNGEFSIDVPFGTQSAPWFPLSGHRCKSVPNSVDVKATVGNRVVGRVRLGFKDDFEPESPYIYRLKRELTIKASRDGE